MITMIKRLLATPSPLEMVARELVQLSHRPFLQKKESAMEYALSMVDYNDARIKRLTRRLDELKEQA